jgi:hypothetical protein
VGCPQRVLSLTMSLTDVRSVLVHWTRGHGEESTELEETMKTPRNTELGNRMKTPQNTELADTMKNLRNSGTRCWLHGCIRGLPAGSCLVSRSRFYWRWWFLWKRSWVISWVRCPSSSRSQSQSHIATNGQLVSMSWCREQSWTFDQRFF